MVDSTPVSVNGCAYMAGSVCLMNRFIVSLFPESVEFVHLCGEYDGKA